MTSIDAVATAEVTMLVVDDDADMRYLARMVLEGSGIAIVGEAADGPEALRKLDELHPPPIPTVVLLDNQMPGLTGLEVAARMLADRPNQLIVLFSAYLSDDIVARAKKIGITRCVSKGDAINLGHIIRDLVASRG